MRNIIYAINAYKETIDKHNCSIQYEKWYVQGWGANVTSVAGYIKKTIIGDRYTFMEEGTYVKIEIKGLAMKIFKSIILLRKQCVLKGNVPCVCCKKRGREIVKCPSSPLWDFQILYMCDFWKIFDLLLLFHCWV